MKLKLEVDIENILIRLLKEEQEIQVKEKIIINLQLLLKDRSFQKDQGIEHLY